MKRVRITSLNYAYRVLMFSLFFCFWLGMLQLLLPKFSTKDNLVHMNVDVQMVNNVRMEIVDAMSIKLFDSEVHLPTSHPLENTCKYPVLHPEEHNIEVYIYHKSRYMCDKVLPNLVGLIHGTLYINDGLAKSLFNESISCRLRPIGGALRPRVMKVDFVDEWQNITGFKQDVDFDQFVVKCDLKSQENRTDNNSVRVYRNAFAQISPRDNLHPTSQFTKNAENTLSIDVVGLDSTSLNQFRRHMPKTWKLMKEVLGTFHFEGFNKVADNSIVNWLPTFTGMRYGNMSNDMPSEFNNTGEPLDVDQIDFIWKKFSRKGCVTMVNDDPMHYSRGLFHYPPSQARGFWTKPSDYYFRPWHVHHRRHPFCKNASKLCFNNEPYFKLQLDLTKQMIKRYKDTCHFSFSFLTEITHDDPNKLELLDTPLYNFLTEYYKSGYFNKTALVIMGDHGNRIGAIQYTFIGRIEERAPFISLTLPKWFKDKHPKLAANLEINKHRLASNYDLYRTMKDILDENFDVTSPLNPHEKGTSLFREIPNNRTCREAQVPDNHCLCMVPTNSTYNIEMRQWSMGVIREYTSNRLKLYSKCQSLIKIEILNLKWLTTNIQVKYGVRDWLGIPIQKRPDDSIEYVDIEYQLIPTRVQATIRLQYDKTRRTLTVNVQPLPVKSTVVRCTTYSDLETFCACNSLKNDLLT